jgi:thiol-disulfide isomerase/thioredoxin
MTIPMTTRRHAGLTSLLSAVLLAGALGSFSSLAPSTHAGAATNSATSAQVIKDVTSVPASVFSAVGASTTSTPVTTPSPVTKQKLLTIGPKPEILYIGAEFCPFCAAERWPLVIALSRFGTFSSLGLIQSAPSPEAYPNTPTLSFYGSKYTSKYVSFAAVETETRTHQPLMNMTSGQSNLVKKYDNANFIGGLPYADGIPFLDLGNRYLQSGSSFTPTILSGSTQARIAARLADPTNSITRTIITAANQLVTDICTLTKQQPAAVCR